MNTETSLSSRYKQRIVIEFLTAENCAPKVIHSRLKNVYGDETIDISNVRRWVRSAKVVEKGQLVVTDKKRPGRPKTAVTEVNTEKVEQLIRENWIFREDWIRQQEPDFFMHAYDKWISRLTKCIEVGGDYVEK